MESQTVVAVQYKVPRQHPPTINGLSHKTNVMQVMSYIVVVLLFVVFTFCIFPTLGLTSQIISGTLFYLSYAALIVLGYICTVFDPTDINVIKEKTARLNNEEFDSSGLDFYCFNCEAHVSPHSKHCRVCDRCVHDFDHHCKWLNNCVGKTNYKLFFCLIISVLVNAIAFTFFSTFALFSYFFLNSNQELADKLYFTLQGDPDFTMGFFQVVLWIFSCLGFIIAFFDGNLVLFHLYIHRKKITTYQYIMNQRELASVQLLQREQKREEKQRQIEEKKRILQQKKEEQQMIISQKKEEQNSKRNSQSIALNPQQQQQLAAGSRQDSLDTHSQRTNNVDIFDSRRAFISKNQTRTSDKMTTSKKIIWCIKEKLLCCLRPKPKEAKVGVIIGLTRIEEQQSELMDDKDNLQMPQQNLDQADEDFPIMNEMNQRGICHSIDVVQEGQLQRVDKIKTLQSNNQLDFQGIDPTNFLSKAHGVIAAVTETQKMSSPKKTNKELIINVDQQDKQTNEQENNQNQNNQENNNQLRLIQIPLGSSNSKKNIDALSIHLSQKAALDSPKVQQLTLQHLSKHMNGNPAAMYKTNSVSNHSTNEKEENNSNFYSSGKKNQALEGEQIENVDSFNGNHNIIKINQSNSSKSNAENRQDMDARSVEKIPHHPPEFNSVSQVSQNSNQNKQNENINPNNNNINNNPQTSDGKSIPQELDAPHQPLVNNMVF